MELLPRVWNSLLSSHALAQESLRDIIWLLIIHLLHPLCYVLPKNRNITIVVRTWRPSLVITMFISRTSLPIVVPSSALLSVIREQILLWLISLGRALVAAPENIAILASGPRQAVVAVNYRWKRLPETSQACNMRFNGKKGTATNGRREYENPKQLCEIKAHTYFSSYVSKK